MYRCDEKSISKIFGGENFDPVNCPNIKKRAGNSGDTSRGGYKTKCKMRLRIFPPLVLAQFLHFIPQEAWVSRVHNKSLSVHELTDQASLILKIEKVSGQEDAIVLDEEGREVKLKYHAVKILQVIKNEASGYTESKMKLKSPPKSGLRISGEKPLAVGQIVSISDRQPLAAPVPDGKSYHSYHIEHAADPTEKVALFFGGHYDKTLSVYFGVIGLGLVSVSAETSLQIAISIRKYFDAIRSHRLDELKSAIAEHPKFINVVDEAWGSPLHFAARYGTKEEIDLLMKSGASLLIQNSKGNIVLHDLVESQFMDNLPYIVDLTVDVNFKNRAGQTPLHLAMQGNASLSIIKILLQAGADPTIKNLSGLSALDLAQNQDRSEIQKALQDLPPKTNAK
jgi:hypothetical protein